MPSLNGNGLLAQALEIGKSFTIDLDMAPPEGGWRREGRMRIQAENDLGDSRWQVRFNGIELAATSDVSEPYPNPYPNCLGQPGEFRAWVVPPRLVRDGINSLVITLVSGPAPVKPVFLDVAMP